ncbi:MAG: ParB N-terminal domain-containing protein, partial [Atopobiaceae bacterium]|nr:ParB N-terminal domain-containing protein [Atopobiaceae bacterium]
MNDTTNTWKATLSLRDIEPSEDNPRQDFGDIAALADRIRATGGQPINPIVCVRDGEAYRIVDGERRYRALLEIYGDAGRTTALVFSDYSDAHAAVAMLATDDKKPLSRREQARGFQTMMRLDVPMADVVHATGIGADELHRARRSLAAASRMADGTQATMDALIAAGADEFSEEERDKILASEWPESEAADIVKSHRRADRLASIRLAMPDGIEFAERGASTDGLLYVTEVKTAKAARELELEDGRDYVAIPPRYELGAPVWTVYERRYGDD